MKMRILSGMTVDGAFLKAQRFAFSIGGDEMASRINKALDKAKSKLPRLTKEDVYSIESGAKKLEVEIMQAWLTSSQP